MSSSEGLTVASTAVDNSFKLSIKRERKRDPDVSSSSSSAAPPLVIEIFKKTPPIANSLATSTSSAAPSPTPEAPVSAPMDAAPNDTTVEASAEPVWLVGDVVWCLQRGNPWWPCLVTAEFSVGEHTRYTNSGSRTVKQHHVQFFGPKPLHAWIHDSSVRPFVHRDEVAGWRERDVAVFKKMSKPRREKAMKAYAPTSKAVVQELEAAKNEAEAALEMPRMERLSRFEFDYQSVENSTEMTSDRRRVKFVPLKPGSAANGETSTTTTPSPPNDAASPPAKRRKSVPATFAGAIADRDNLTNNNDSIDNQNLTAAKVTIVNHRNSLPANQSPAHRAPTNRFLANRASTNHLPSMSIGVVKPASIKFPLIAKSRFSPEKKPSTMGAGLEASVRTTPAKTAPASTSSSKTSFDSFSKFCLCHSAEMKRLRPDLDEAGIEAELRSRWEKLDEEEVTWYIYNSVPPGKLLPGKKRARPKKFLERLLAEYKRKETA